LPLLLPPLILILIILIAHKDDHRAKHTLIASMNSSGKVGWQR
jgi:hypothetical protein